MLQLGMGSVVAAGGTCVGVGNVPVEKCPRPYSDDWNYRRSMNLWQRYHLATSIADALQALSSPLGETRLIAGGSDLLLDIQQGRHAPVQTLVDVSEIPELLRLELTGDLLYIGAAVPLQRVEASATVRQHAQALVEACGLIGGPQVRNTATLGGNVAHALPAADGAIALLALGATAEIASSDGRRIVGLEELYLGPGRSTLHPQKEILVGFQIPVSDKTAASSFRRVMRPQGVAIAILNLGVWLERSGDRISDVRIAAGPGGKIPFRGRAAEELLRGQVFEPALISRAIDELCAEASFRTSRHRATQAYRYAMAGVLLEMNLDQAWERTFTTD